MEAQMHGVERGPPMAAERVIESAVELTRAEAVLALARARVLLIKMMGVLLATMLTLAAAQVALMMIALSPMLFKDDGWSAVLFALVPAVGLTAVGARVALLAWRELKNAASATAVQGES